MFCDLHYSLRSKFMTEQKEFSDVWSMWQQHVYTCTGLLYVQAEAPYTYEETVLSCFKKSLSVCFC